MLKPGLFIVTVASASFWAGSATAFRNCNTEDSNAYAMETQYVVGEIEFDATTGLASGTQTTYNYANQDAVGFTECHITYELSGSYNPGTETFVLDATRTNHSAACPRVLIAVDYPDHQLYAFQMTFNADGTSLTHVADNGDLLASGSWDAGKAFYKTTENCTVF